MKVNLIRTVILKAFFKYKNQPIKRIIPFKTLIYMLIREKETSKINNQLKNDKIYTEKKHL